MEAITKIIVLGFIVEATVDSLKLIYQDKKVQVSKILSLLIGLLIAYSTQQDLLQIIKINESVGIIGIGLSGIAISRGGNFVNDLFEKIGRNK